MRRYRIPLILFLVAATPRLVLALVFLRAPIGLDDMHQYDMLGRSLAADNGYRWYGRTDVARLRRYLDRVLDFPVPTRDVPLEGHLTAHRPPGYPAFLGAVYRLAGNRNRLPAVRLLQVPLGASLAPIAYALARLLRTRGPVPTTAGTMVAMYPILWFYPAGLGSENLFIPFASTLVLLLLLAEQKASLSVAALAGLCAGLATLTRSIMVAFLPIAALWLWRRISLRHGVLFSLLATSLVLPWAIRNSLLLRRPTFVEASLGYNLFVGYHPSSNGGFEPEVAAVPLQFLDNASRERWSMEQTSDFIRADPGRLPALVLKRAAYFWDLEDREMIYFYSNGYLGPIAQPWLALGYIFLILPFMAVSLLFPLGMALRREQLLLALGFVLSLTLPHLLILAEPRFHLPLIPLLAVYAAIAFHTPQLRTRLRRGIRQRDPAWLMAMLFMVFLLLAWAWTTSNSYPRLLRAMAPGGHELLLDY